ncbi:DUF1295-like protein [Alternaria alternata]|nr:DUF1295-like protein [Alternaria alternata]
MPFMIAWLGITLAWRLFYTCSANPSAKIIDMPASGLPHMHNSCQVRSCIRLRSQRCMGSYLYKRIQSDEGKDSRFDSIRTSPPKFFVAFFAQATWVSLCTLPVILVNSVPRSAYATSLLGKAVSSKPYLTDILGLAIFVFGLTFEVVADRQKDAWVQAKKQKKHSEEFLTHGLWSKSRHPNYFGEATLWSGIAIAAAGLLVRQPAQAALGLSGGLGGQVLVAGMCAASPAFVSFLLLKVSGVPLSENKYDERYGDRKDYQKWKRETPMFVPKIWNRGKCLVRESKRLLTLSLAQGRRAEHAYKVRLARKKKDKNYSFYYLRL